MKFTLIENKFLNNFAKESGGAIYFKTIIPKSFKTTSNFFKNNSALNYSNDLASCPSYIGIINKELIKFEENDNYYQDFSLDLPISNVTIQSGVIFNLNFSFLILDQFFQRSFPIKNKM